MQRCCSVALPRSLFARAPPAFAATPASARFVHDITITRTGKPIIRNPDAGRSSIGGHTVTVFGATGFLGRYIVSKLARKGCQVIIPFREEMAKRHLKVTGDLGRVVFMEFDLRNTQSIEESVRHSDVVYNLIGRQYTTKNFLYEDVHVEGTERIVEAVAKYDVDRYIHVSSFNADRNSPSLFYKTKAQGEEVARSLFPETTIVRPSPMYGDEDFLLNKLGTVKNLLTANNMQERFRPVHVFDVARGLEALMYDDATAGQTFEFYGPKEFSMKEIADLVDKEIVKKRRHINLPKPIFKTLARALDFIWWSTISPDEVERQFIDQVVDPNAKTLKDLGIEPDDITKWILHYTRQYRSNLYYDLPPMTEKEKREERKYLHVENDM